MHLFDYNLILLYKLWNATGTLVKECLMLRYTGVCPVMGRCTDSGCMSSYLTKVLRSEVQIPEDVHIEDFRLLVKLMVLR